MTSTSNSSTRHGSPDVIRRARWLLVFGSATPLSLFVIAMVLIMAEHIDALRLGVIGGTALLLAVLGARSLHTHRDDPSTWQRLGTLPGALAASFFGLVAHANSYDEKFSTNPVIGYAVLAAIAGTIVLPGWLSARRAERTVVEALLSGEIDNRMTVGFRVRRHRYCELFVGNDSLVLRLSSTSRSRVSVSLTETTSVDRWSIAAGGEHQLPGEEQLTIPLTPGPAVRIVVPGGDWIFPTDEPARIQQFIERRLAAARARTQQLPSDELDE